MLARLVFCFENNPERHDDIISGAQDSIGICVPGLVRHYYDNNFWPEKIESTQDEMTLRFLEDHLVMIPMEPRRPGCSVVEGKDITPEKVKALADTADACWKAMSALTQAAVYGAYFLMALPAGWIIRKWGYRRGVITGLVLFGIGALMFIPGSRINSFYFFVLSLFVIGCGLTCLETSGNPYTTVLGHPDKAESRINLSQSLNGIGWIVGPLVGGQLLFSGVNIAIPYALVGIFVLSVALVLSRIKLPDPRRAHEVDTNKKVEEKPMRVMAFGFGMLTLFLYVAAQTGVNSFFINYAEESIYIEKQTASLYLAFGGMGLFFIGRLAGGVIMNYVQPRLVLLVCAILTFVATLIVVVCSGTLSLIAFFALYLGESIMFPTIFSLALRDAGTKTKLASSLLIMTIVGGAVAPVIMGYIADTTGSMAIAFLIPLVCYGVIGGYAAMPRCSSLDVKRD